MSLKARAKHLFFLLADKSGLIEKRWKNLEPGVYIFNYHRIGDAQKTLFDRAIYSCNSQALEKQVIDIKNNFEILSTNELHNLYQKNQSFTKRYALITFDDGYIDNYTTAFPILKKHNVNATFFLTTNYVEQKAIPWWDQVAFLLRHSINQQYTIPGTERTFTLSKRHIDKTIQRIMYYIKQSKDYSTTDVLEHVKQSFPEANRLLSKQKPILFLNWQHATEMSRNGMTIGSHTLNHYILSQLTNDEQVKEISYSKPVIEQKLSLEINTIAYPVGRYHCFNEFSLSTAKEAGYQLGFSNEPGINQSTHNQYQLFRYSVATSSLQKLRYEISL